jgi:hypothetical protein
MFGSVLRLSQTWGLLRLVASLSGSALSLTPLSVVVPLQKGDQLPMRSSLVSDVPVPGVSVSISTLLGPFVRPV